MTNGGIKHHLEVLLTQIDKHLDAAERALQEGKTTQAEAEVHQSREHTRKCLDLVARISN
jgi:hypothetical protein